MKRYTAAQMREFADVLEMKDVDEVQAAFDRLVASVIRQAAADQDLLRRLVEADRAYDAGCIEVRMDYGDESTGVRARVLAEAEGVL